MNKYDILINQDNPYDENLISFELISTLNTDGETIEVERKTLESYEKLKATLLEKHNLEIGLSSGYRSLKRQRELKIEYALIGEDHLVAEPGTSEHHTGLAIDIDLKEDGVFLESNDDLYAAEDTWKIIHQLISDYGFILRYPKDKVDITKIPYEPWHFRYVGHDLAKYLEDQNFALEEYYDLNKSYKRI